MNETRILSGRPAQRNRSGCVRALSDIGRLISICARHAGPKRVQAGRGIIHVASAKRSPGSLKLVYCRSATYPRQSNRRHRKVFGVLKQRVALKK